MNVRSLFVSSENLAKPGLCLLAAALIFCLEYALNMIVLLDVCASMGEKMPIIIYNNKSFSWTVIDFGTCRGFLGSRPMPFIGFLVRPAVPVAFSARGCSTVVGVTFGLTHDPPNGPKNLSKLLKAARSLTTFAFCLIWKTETGGPAWISPWAWWMTRRPVRSWGFCWRVGAISMASHNVCSFTPWKVHS